MASSRFAMIQWKSAAVIYKDTVVQQQANDCGAYTAWNLRMILAKKRPAKSASDAKSLAVALRQEFLTEAHSIITSGGLAYRCRQEVLQAYIEGSAGDAAEDKGKPSGVKSDGKGVEGKGVGVKSKASSVRSKASGVKSKASGAKSNGMDVKGKASGMDSDDDPPNINSLIDVMSEDAMGEGDDLDYDTDSSDGFAGDAFTAQKTEDLAWHDHHDKILKLKSGSITKSMASVIILGNRQHGMPNLRF
ncbi:hypothetical protein J4E83_002929 [Alternaria metachromatica]|uniref:uncharacterized protein n=1 Tax=Alternaria metachromatica TaxID=283354 RepID=UPI0020C3BB78|nr:uncharacterized protein J4E83_002929 [Alternaria metachromatica]KAI4631398.1 hypothetical protein J4E83_002929 [Alternaria metachromatica]